MTASKDKRGRKSIPRRLLRLPTVMLAAVVIFAALVVFVTTPLNISARIGAYPGIGGVLHSYMRQWARNWSYWIEKPEYIDLSDAGLVRLGAGYFETGCAACHGAPGRARNPVVKMMEPPPPDLASGEVSNLSDKELYWIVWNGVRYTAMPGWTGDHREDEVWAMVAFLRNYEEVAPQDYIRLAYGDVQAQADGDGGAISFSGPGDRLDKAVQNCARCHGVDGMGRDGTAPKIAGQSRQYLTATLAGYASGKRASGVMQPIAAALSNTEIARLAAHYGDMQPDAKLHAATHGETNAPDTEAERDLRTLGERLASKGDPSRFVPSCRSCHEVKGTVAPRAEYPRIAGQESRFIEAWLWLYRDRPAGGTDFSNVMHVAAKGLSDHQIKALAAWYSALPYDAGGEQAKSGAAVPPG